MIVESNYLGVRVQYLDDETFLFVPAARVIAEVCETNRRKSDTIPLVEDKRLPVKLARPKRQYHFDRSAMSKASKKMHARKRKATSE